MKNVVRNIDRLSVMLGVLFSLVLCSAVAKAQVPPGGFYAIAGQGPGQSINHPGTVTGSVCVPSGCETSTATIAYSYGNASGSIGGTVTGGAPNAGAGAGADIYFWIAGPASVSVPLIFTASGSTSASGPDAAAYAYAQWAGPGFYACSASGELQGLCGSMPASFSGSQHFNLESQTLSAFSVTLDGSAAFGSSSFAASIDPMVQIDPSFPQANEFSLIFSAGPSAPEPGTLALFGSGALGLAALLRRRLGI